MGEVFWHKDKIGGVGPGLSSKKQITPADVVLAESANEVGPVLFDPCSLWTLTCCVVFVDPAIMPLGTIVLEDVLEGT
jgi:hypothetical protein